LSWKTIGCTKKLKFQETIFKNHESERSNDTAPKTSPYIVRIKKCIWGSRTKLWIPKHWSISPRILYPYVVLDSIYSVGIGDTLNLQLKGFSIYGIEELTITQVSIDDWKSYSSFELKQTYVLATKTVGGECQEAIFTEENGEWIYLLNYHIDLSNMSERSCRRGISEVSVFENIAYRVYQDPSKNWFLKNQPI
jgi:hypothetical protein